MGILWTLFVSFVKVGLFAVGGGYVAIPLIQEQIVNKHGLLTMAEFTELITIAEIAPGAITINSSTVIGQRIYGTIGAVVCTVGVIIPTFLFCLTIAHLYYKYKKVYGIQIVLAAIKPAVVALIAGTGISILMLALFNSDLNNIVLSEFRWLEFGLFLGGFIILRKYRIKPIGIIIVTGLIGTVLQFIINAI